MGEINPEAALEMGRPSGKIGIDQNGINHIRIRHRHQIRSYSDEQIINYVWNVLCNINYYEDGLDGALKLLWIDNNNANLVVVEELELELVSGFYRVKTAFKSKPRRFKNKKLIMCGKTTTT